MTLLNNYFLRMKQINTPMNVRASYIGITPSNPILGDFTTFDVETFKKIKLTTGQTIAQAINDSNCSLKYWVGSKDNNTGIGFAYHNGYIDGTSMYWYGDISNQCFMVGESTISLQTSDSLVDKNNLQDRTLHAYDSTLQNQNDYLPPFLRTESWTNLGRTSVFFRIGEGVQNDQTQVTKADYDISNIISLSDVTISAIRDVSTGNIIITLYNTTNSAITIREVGMYDTLVGRVRYGDPSNGGTTSGSISESETSMINTACAGLYNTTNHGNPIRYETNDPYEGNGYCVATVAVPYCISRTKLTTPIVLQPEETKSITYEIKY